MTVRPPHDHGEDEGIDRRSTARAPAPGALEADHSGAHPCAGDHGTSGPRDSLGRPTILSISCAQGERVSRIRRADGSTFTVIVPRGGIDRPWAGARPATAWIHEDGPPRRVPASALARLAARVGRRAEPSLELLPAEG